MNKLYCNTPLLLDHCWSLQAETPGYNIDIFRQTHGKQHLGSEDPTITNLNPLAKTLVIAEYLHARLSVRVVSRFESQLLNPQFLKELVEHSYKVTQSKTPVSYNTFYLVKLSKVSGIYRSTLRLFSIKGQ